MSSGIQELKSALRRQVGATARWAVSNVQVLARYGPRGNLRYAMLGRARSERVHVFGQGLSSEVPLAETQRWYLATGHLVVIAMVGTPSGPIGDWINRVSKQLDSHFLVALDAVPLLQDVDPESFSAMGALGDACVDYFSIKSWAAQHRPKWDLLVFDARQPLVSVDDIIRLQHAAYTYDRGQQEIGFVTPALNIDGQRVLGYEWDREAQGWASRQPADDHGQHEFARYVLAANAHGLYATHRALDHVRFGSSDARGLSLDEQARRIVALAWRQNIRTLALPSVELDVHDLPAPQSTEFDREWLTGREVTDGDGRRRIIFVLTGTSISGGIRTVFEQADGFVELGFAVEIWALEGQPDWFDLHVPVRTFKSYFDMIPALRNEHAIKVATWWETAEVVWLGSVNCGIAVNYVQEFETWFYPNDRVARGAVASSYRLEMAHLTIASFQQEELAGVGVGSTYIPSCFDGRKFRVLSDIQRRDDTAMAVGRSFFQKNFAMTAGAWSSLGQHRPRLALFGFEPDILIDEKVDYLVRPSDERVNEMYNEASLFIQTSFHEGFSLPLIEAMAAGCPVITTDSHGNRDFCRDDVNCVIVEQNDVTGLADAIRELIDDPEKRRRLAAAGVATAAEYRQDVIFHRLEEFYNSLA